MKSIDVFCHLMPPDYAKVCMEEAPHKSHMFVRALNVATMSDMNKRLEVFKSFPGYKQIPNIVSPPVETFAGPDKSPRLAALGNDEIKKIVEAHPECYEGFIAGIPFNNVQASVEEIKRVKDMGAKGIQIYTHMNGEAIDGVSGGIFSGIAIGYFAYDWASKVQEGQLGYSSASTVLKNGVVSNLFFTFFLMLFLVAIGMKVGGGIGAIFKRYGIKFVVIGVMIPVLSMVVTVAAYNLVLKNNPTITEFETIGMFAGAMTSTPAYGTALDAAGKIVSGDALEAASLAPAPAALSAYYHLRDMLLTQVVCLSAMLDYLHRGGCSRGSALYTDPAGDLPAEGLPELFRCKLDRGAHGDRVQEIGWQPSGIVQVSWRKVRPIPQPDDFLKTSGKRTGRVGYD